ncbi:MAG TPA: hypothetical protein VFV68_11215 [Agriterribacter sp.]|nr:hypothetical protein [Agriterribacter sp.]
MLIACKIAFAPRIQKNKFRSFFTAAEGWGNMEQKRSDQQQTNIITLAYGILRLKSMEVELEGTAKKITLFAEGKNIPVSSVQKDNALTITFDETMIGTNQSIVLTVQL